jgi:WD40 repeat protein
MVLFNNENLLKLVFHSFPLFKTKQILEDVNNKTATKVILKVLNFKNIFRSIGQSNTILVDDDRNSIISFPLHPYSNKVPINNVKSLKTCKMSDIEYILYLENKYPRHQVVLLYNCYIAYYTNSYGFEIWNTKEDTRMKIGFKHHLVVSIVLLSNGNIACNAIFNNINPHILILDYKKNYSCTHLLGEHEHLIDSLVNLSDNRFASASHDKTIKIWDIAEHYKCVRTLHGHNGWVLCLLFIEKNGLLFSGSSDDTIKAWDTNDYQCVRTIQTYGGGIANLLLLPNGYFASSFRGKSGIIKIWDVDRLTCVNTIKGNDDTITSLFLLKDYRIVSASKDDTFVIWSY